MVLTMFQEKKQKRQSWAQNISRNKQEKYLNALRRAEDPEERLSQLPRL